MKKILIVVAAVAVAVGLGAFEPWRAFTSSTVDEALPVVTGTPAPEPSAGTGAVDVPEVPSAPEVLSTGRFRNAEHGTTGNATILRLPDGRRYLRLEDLSTSDGPDLHVWLSDATAGGRWGKYDDGRYLRLGKLKATNGNQNYLIPAGADLSGMRSAVIWCDRFNVAFGTAPVKVA